MTDWLIILQTHLMSKNSTTQKYNKFSKQLKRQIFILTKEQ